MGKSCGWLVLYMAIFTGWHRCERAQWLGVAIKIEYESSNINQLAGKLGTKPKIFSWRFFPPLLLACMARSDDDDGVISMPVITTQPSRNTRPTPHNQLMSYPLCIGESITDAVVGASCSPDQFWLATLLMAPLKRSRAAWTRDTNHAINIRENCYSHRPPLEPQLANRSLIFSMSLKTEHFITLFKRAQSR